MICPSKTKTTDRTLSSWQLGGGGNGSNTCLSAAAGCCLLARFP
jgi:hypothetical protein